jgi:hypothetical protein
MYILVYKARLEWAESEVREEETHRISSALKISDVNDGCVGVGLMRLAASHLGARRLFFYLWYVRISNVPY